MEQTAAFVVFAFVASITPGPTNILVLAVGTRQGFRSALPIVLGAGAGAATIVLIVGNGIGAYLTDHPLLQQIMFWSGAVWLSLLAWKMSRSSAVGADSSPVVRPRYGVLAGAGLQLVNPKTWMMALAVVGVFAGNDPDVRLRVFHLSVMFFLVAVPCLSTWAYAGAGAAKLLTSPGKARLFNQSMALLLLASVWVAAMI